MRGKYFILSDPSLSRALELLRVLVSSTTTKLLDRLETEHRAMTTRFASPPFDCRNFYFKSNNFTFSKSQSQTLFRYSNRSY